MRRILRWCVPLLLIGAAAPSLRGELIYAWFLHCGCTEEPIQGCTGWNLTPTCECYADTVCKGDNWHEPTVLAMNEEEDPNWYYQVWLVIMPCGWRWKCATNGLGHDGEWCLPEPGCAFYAGGEGDKVYSSYTLQGYVQLAPFPDEPCAPPPP
jgi:hypothetical protein